ncbi:MAG TPA: hypothetical protein VJ550_09760 [Geomonas sp.]|nr:hypothetical protein [Geomonas sp.]
MNLVIITNKRYNTDFRKYLIRAAENSGHKTVHVYSWDKVIISHGGKESRTYTSEVDPKTIYAEVHRLIGDGKTVILTGMGGYTTPFAMQARKHFPDSLFIYDVYDDFRYEKCRWELVTRYLNDLRWRFYCDKTMVLEKGLQRLYPSSFHLNNASHLRPLPYNGDPTDHRLVYIGSIDRRVNFDLLGHLAAQSGVTLDIYGSCHCDSIDAEEFLQNLLQQHPNVTFKGPYDNDDLPNILSRYRIGIVPYKVNHRLTRHVNPDKIYHYLNSGLEVIASPIPQALQLADYLHLVHVPQDWATVLDEAAHKPRAGKNWPAEDFTWVKRWKELQTLVG